MSFFKKLFATEDLTPEERERQEKEKAEKKAQKEKEYQLYQERREKEKEAKQAEKEKKKELELQRTVKFFGPNPGFTVKTNYTVYKNVLIYLENNVLSPTEEVLSTIPAEYDKTKKREIKGVLVATNERLIFATSGIGHGEFVEVLEYSKMNGISLAPDGFSQKELLIDYGRSRKTFDDIVNDANFTKFLAEVRQMMNQSIKIGKVSKPTKAIPSQKQEDKYETLAKLGKLRDNGILSDKEFEIEKQKILNSKWR
ncbi:SHOCT domain-containing protein [Bacillus sp. DJP31]|uniref:SHOCT domain-containing protein n=1 Tax=Bacillus sp. DJP31 TaxID=3409789 RepID=UPI003BB58F99